MAVFKRVASLEDVPEGRGIALEIGKKRIVLFNIEGELLAVQASCAQHGAPLERGVIHEGNLQCPWHGVAFDVRRGICAAFPNETSATTYDVRVEGDDILLAM